MIVGLLSNEGVTNVKNKWFWWSTTHEFPSEQVCKATIYESSGHACYITKKIINNPLIISHNHKSL